MPIRRPPAFLLGCLLCAAPAFAQVADSFTDGDFLTDPAWTGTLAAWSVDTLEGGLALRSAGSEARDTLWLATASDVAYGAWTFSLAAPGVNLSSVNGVRLYLIADRTGLDGPVHGYFLQLGTNNADRLALYRQDGFGTSSNRVRLARSAPIDGPADSLTTVTVRRSPGGRWTVYLDGKQQFEASDDTYTASRAFGVWVKHSSTTGDAYWFDDLTADPTADVSPPRLLRLDVPDSLSIRLLFDEHPATCATAAFDIRPEIGAPAEIGCPAEPDSTIRLDLGRPLRRDVRYRLRASDLRDAAGNALELDLPFWFEPPDEPEPGDIVVNEFWASPPEAGLEFVEVYNRSPRRLDLSRLTLADDRDTPIALPAESPVLPPGGFAVLVEDSARFAGRFPGISLLPVSPWPALNNGGDAIVLAYDAATIDRVEFDATWSDRAGSAERVDPDGPSDFRGNWAESTAPNDATPGLRNSAYAPDTTSPLVTFVEQTTDTTIRLVFDEPVSLPADPLTIRLDGLDRTARVLPDSDSVLVVVTAPLGEASRLVVAGPEDYFGNRMPPTALEIARAPRTGELLLNELLFDPLADPDDGRPDQSEYVELHNASPYLLTLRRVFWSDAPDERGRADTLRLTEANLALPPGGYAVVVAAGSADDAWTERFRSAFQDLPRGTDVNLLPHPRQTLGMGNEGDVIRLHRADGRLLEYVIYDPGWHTPVLSATRGTALERRTVGEPIGPSRANDPALWTSSVDPSGGTPGRANTRHIDRPASATTEQLVAVPRPFSPDGDGFDDAVSIHYALPFDDALIRATVFDLRGRPVRRLEAGRFTGPNGALYWDGFDDGGRSLPTGVYVVTLEAVAGERVGRFKTTLVLVHGRRSG